MITKWQALHIAITIAIVVVNVLIMYDLQKIKKDFQTFKSNLKK